MKHELIYKRWNVIILLLLVVNIGISLLVKSSITNYSFSKTYISNFIKESDRNFLIINIGCIVFFLLMISARKSKNNINMMNVIRIFLSVIILIGFILNLIIEYKSTIQVECKISGNSMTPTIYSDEQVRLSFIEPLEKNKIVIFQVDNRNFDVDCDYPQYYVKRIIGLSGEQIKYIHNQLYINDALVKEEYLTDESFSKDSYDFLGTFKYKKDGILYQTEVIPEGYCFVMGDNRKVDKRGNNESYDSREMGLVPLESIIGVVIQ